MRITVLAGGVGAARFLRGLRRAAPEAEITVIGNTGDDITLFGLRVCPDLDTVMYTLGGGINEDQGWGRDEETFTIRAELAAYEASPDWFTLGDKDFATHIRRSQLLARRPAAVRRDRGAVPAVAARRAAAADVGRPGRDPRGARRSAGASAWCTSRSGGCACTPRRPRRRSSRPARSGPGRRPACSRPSSAADVVLFPPSNPVVSIGTILAVPGIRAAVAAKTVVGVSPDHRRLAGTRDGRRLPGRDRGGHLGRGGRPRTTGRS